MSSVPHQPRLGRGHDDDCFYRQVLIYFVSGLKFELREVNREELEGHILAANQDDGVDGIIVYYPIFNNRQDQYLQQLTDVSKDVEGLSHRYIFNLYQNNRFLDESKLQKSVLPCTPLAVIKILEYLRIYNIILPYGNRLFGHSITVVNRSEVVGRPLAALLANDGACVYSVDVTGVQQFTRGEGIKKKRHEVVEREGWGMKDCVPLSDVVISGVPGDSFKFPTELLREGAVCINFSSEKVKMTLSAVSIPLQYFGITTHTNNPCFVELTEFWTRSKGESIYIRTSNRQGDNHGIASEYIGMSGKKKPKRSLKSKNLPI